MSVSRAEQQAIKMRRAERQEQQREKEMAREMKLAHAAGMTWMQWKVRQDDLKRLADFKETIEIAKRDPELRVALLRELGCHCIADQKALPVPE
jgi:hypothetical protein